MKRSLPSSSTNKRKRQEAFIEGSPFDASTPRKVAVNSFAAASDAAALNLEPERNKATPSTIAGSRSKNEGNKPKGIMAFSAITRGVIGIGKGLPETPSRGKKISSPGLPVPTGIPLMRLPGLPSPVHPELPFGVRGGPDKAGGSTKGTSLTPKIMTPLSSLTAQARTAGSPSPSVGIPKNRHLHPLAQPDLFATRQPPGNDGAHLELSEGRLPVPQTTVLSIAQAQQARSTTMEPDHLLISNGVSGQPMSRSKGKAAEGNQDSLTRYLNRLLSKQQSLSSLFLANLALSNTHSTLHGNQISKTDTSRVNTTSRASTSSILATADIIVKVERPLLPVQHVSPIFECRVLSTNRALSLKFQSINPSDQLLVSFSGHSGSLDGTTGIRGTIEPCRLAQTMKQLYSHEEAGLKAKEIAAGIWQPWYEVALDNSDETGMPQVVLLCSRFVIMEK